MAELKKDLKDQSDKLRDQSEKFSNYQKSNENDKMKTKVIYALQDLNSYDQLECTIPPLKKLRNFRVNDCHYWIP